MLQLLPTEAQAPTSPLGSPPFGAGDARSPMLRGGWMPAGDASPMEVKFSDDRFLRRILQEAQRGCEASNEEAARRLQGMGFGHEVAKVALQIAGGEERRALELCVSGLALMESASPALRGSVEAASQESSSDSLQQLQEQQQQTPTPLRCDICGQRHLTQKTLEIHRKLCLQRVEQREARRSQREQQQQQQRQQLVEKVELLLPAEGSWGSESLEQVMASTLVAEEALPPDSGALADDTSPRQAATACAREELLPCTFCKRIFVADRLETHLKSCLQRTSKAQPASADASTGALPPPRASQQRRRGGSSPGGSALPPSDRTRQSQGGSASPPSAGARGYVDFSNNLERCPGCSRQFRPEAFQAHARQCTAVRSKQQVGGGGKTPGGGSGTATRHQHPRRPTIIGNSGNNGGAGRSKAGPSSPSSSVMTLPARRSQSSPSPASLGCSATASPPTGGGGGGGGASSPTSTGVWSPTPQSRQHGPQSVEATLQSSSDLVSRGFVTDAAPDVKAALQLQVEERMAGVEFVNVYEVCEKSHSSMYGALKTTMQEERGGELPLEKELWHGTAWNTIPRILRHGFNRSFAGRHGTLLGIATYFSTDPAYSQRFCDRRGAGRDGTKVMLLSRVLVGRYCKGSPTDVEPPMLNAESGERYDSTVDHLEKPSIFAVFRDFQAVPLFLVEFRTGGAASTAAASDKKSGV